jgi:CheY-like chemotaxis protein
MIGTPVCLMRSLMMANDIPKEVLVVEDQALVRMTAADALVDGGFMAWEAGNADEALEALDQHPSIGLLFTDVDMPGGMDGLELARHVHNERPDVELVVTSGAVTIAGKDLPDHGTFLPKPYPAQRLVQIVASKLEGGSS